jgi:hypothetical protein
MKILLAALLLFVGAAYAQASEVLALNAPAPSPFVRTTQTYCFGVGFSADGQTVNGICEYVGYSVAKYAQPPKAYLYATWNLTGLGTAGAVAPVTRETYHSVVTVNGVPMYLIDTSVGSIELVENQSELYLAFP